MILGSVSQEIRKFKENFETSRNFSLLPRKVFLVPRLVSKMIILSMLVRNYQKLLIEVLHEV